MRSSSRIASLAVLCLLYFTGLTGVGMLTPDEPRYAAIGRAMAQTGDWITPHLWGTPWFEKPPLLYWMTAAAFRLGLGEDLAPRLPVAVLSVCFLVFLFIVVRREFGERIAWYSTVILATSAGWLAYGHIGVTDLPMSAAFSAAMLLLMRSRERRPKLARHVAAGILLGVAILGKALVPVVLFFPAIWFLRRRVRDLALAAVLTAAVALPWFVLCYRRNGAPFLDDLIWKQHFTRFTTATLQHVQPFWFFVPVLLASFFPWTPLFCLMFRKFNWADERVRFLVAWLLFGLVFFSASRNKLPGYILPLMPAASILLGIALGSAKRTGVVLAASAILVGFVPAIRAALPQALVSGLGGAPFHLSFAALAAAILVGATAFLLAHLGRRVWAFSLVAGVMVASFLQFVMWDLNALDHAASARPLWYHNLSKTDKPCIPNVKRTIRYGLDYYAQQELPECPSK